MKFFNRKEREKYKLHLISDNEKKFNVIIEVLSDRLVVEVEKIKDKFHLFAY